MVVKQNAIIVNDIVLNYHEFKREIIKPWGNIYPFTALKNIKFHNKRGRNCRSNWQEWSRKSTLLKCLFGLLRPTSGEVVTYGRVFLLAGADPA